MTVEEKALALVNAVKAERNWPIIKRIHRGGLSYDEALCRAIERHEADNARNEQRLADQAKAFSDAVKRFFEINMMPDSYRDCLSPFILPEPDPLVEALDKMLRRRTMNPDREVLADEAAFLTAELAARGWKMNLERIEQ